MTVSLWRGSRAAADPALQVNFSWTRSIDPGRCGAALVPTRTTAFLRTVALPPGQRVTLRDEGGVTIVLRRR